MSRSRPSFPTPTTRPRRSRSRPLLERLEDRLAPNNLPGPWHDLALGLGPDRPARAPEVRSTSPIADGSHHEVHQATARYSRGRQIVAEPSQVGRRPTGVPVARHARKSREMASGLGASLEFPAVQIPGIESPARPLVNSSAASVGPMGQNPGTGATAPPPSRTAPASSPPPVVNPVAMASTSPTNFNSDGGYTVTPWPGGTNPVPEALAVQANGQIVTAGVFGNGRVAIARYNTDGTLDTSYGSGGSTATLLPHTSPDFGNGLALQSDGKAVVVGWADSMGTYTDVAALRYSTEGSLDSTFNGRGWVTTDLNRDTNSANAVGIQSLGPNAGKIVAAGSTVATINGVRQTHSLILRYTTNGQLDSGAGGFGQAGKKGPLGYTITQVNPNGPDQINALIIQPDDKIVAAGETDYSSNDQLTLARYNSDGSLDTTFGANQAGTLLLPATQLNSELQWTHVTAVSLQPQSDGTNKIVVVGSAVMSDPTSTTSTRSVLVVRFNADGTLDGTFDGGQGYTLVGNGSAAGVAVDASGRIIVGGWGSDGVSVERLSPDGTVDTTFGTSGVKTSTLFGGLSGSADSLILTSDGNIYTCGTAVDSSDNSEPLLVHFNDMP